MKKSSPKIAAIFIYVSSLIVIFISLPTLARPFDWQYNYLSTPFSVFYNPSLLGNNAGYTLGVDGMYVDEEIYDARMALVIPVGGIATLEDHRGNREIIGRRGILKYPYHSHKSSSSAVSVGGIYNSNESYKISAGFAAPIEHVQSGLAVNFSSGGERPIVSMSAGLSVNVLDKSAHVALLNFFANDRDNDNLFGISAGVSAAAYSNQYVVVIPVEALAAFYFDEGSVFETDFSVRATADFTPFLTGRERTGMTAAISVGYKYAKQELAGLEVAENSVFASLGVVFMGRTNSAALFGAHDFNDAHRNYGAFIYNSFREGSGGIFTGKEFSVDLKYRETDDGNILFDLSCRRNNVMSWVLRIDGQNGESVKTFSGGNAVPSTILWDKISSTGEKVKDGSVRAKLIVSGIGGSVSESEWIAVP